MIVPPEYTVMGGDGKEYGAIGAAQIREWIAEGRLEKKSPVKPPGAPDWLFLGSLPEFADAFTPPAAARPSARPGTNWWLAAGAVAVAAIIFAVVWILGHN